MSASRLLSRLLGADRVEDDPGSYSLGEDHIEPKGDKRRGQPEERHRSLDFTIERVAETIAELPVAVPRESAVLIVRRTLEAAGVKLSELDSSTGVQESKLSSEVELARARQKEVSEKTQETVRSLEKEIRKARESCENIMLYEERKISHASATLRELRRVRAFFGLPGSETEEGAGPGDQDTPPPSQVHEPFDVEQAQIFDTPLAQVFDMTQPSGGRGERLTGDGCARSVSGHRVYTSHRRVNEDENTLPVIKEEAKAEREPSMVKKEIRVREDAVQDDEIRLDDATARVSKNIQHRLRVNTENGQSEAADTAH